MALRMAWQALAKPVGNLLKGSTKADLALRFGPDLGYAALASTVFAPENATLGERAAMGGEDLIYGLGSSFLGQGIGRGIGRRKAAKAMQGKPRNAQTRQDYANTVSGYTTGGDVLGQMGMVALPRPVTQGVYEAAAERGNETAVAVNENQRGMLEEQQLATLIGQLIEGGYLAGQTLGQPSITSARALNA